MLNQETLQFYNPSAGQLNFQQVVEEIFTYIKKQDELRQEYEIIVGCDSSSDIRPAFPIALVVLRKGSGGRFFLAKINYPIEHKFYNIRQRILQEVYLSCEFALMFKEAFRQRLENEELILPYQFEYIHADVGGSNQTREMIKEVVGLIKSNGFEAKIKPESFVASVVADRFT